MFTVFLRLSDILFFINQSFWIFWQGRREGMDSSSSWLNQVAWNTKSQKKFSLNVTFCESMKHCSENEYFFDTFFLSPWTGSFWSIGSSSKLSSSSSSSSLSSSSLISYCFFFYNFYPITIDNWLLFPLLEIVHLVIYQQKGVQHSFLLVSNC